MGRNSNKIDSIAVDTVSQEVNRHELLHPDFNKGLPSKKSRHDLLLPQWKNASR